MGDPNTELIQYLNDPNMSGWGMITGPFVLYSVPTDFARKPDYKCTNIQKVYLVCYPQAVNFIKVGHKARIIEIALSICALRLCPTFWEAFYWCKSLAPGRRVQNEFMKSTQGWKKASKFQTVTKVYLLAIFTTS